MTPAAFCPDEHRRLYDQHSRDPFLRTQYKCIAKILLPARTSLQLEFGGPLSYLNDMHRRIRIIRMENEDYRARFYKPLDDTNIPMPLDKTDVL